MEMGKLGQLVVPAMGLGCMGMSEFYGAADKTRSVRTIRAALDNGINFFDTADMYGVEGANELLLAEALKGHRSRAIIATKFGVVRDSRGNVLGIDGHPQYVHRSIDASLRRLGTDYIDLYYQHMPDPSVPIEETVGAMKELVEKGKVRYIGLSNIGAEALVKAHRIHPIAALQAEYSLWSREVEQALPILRELGTGLVAYSPLGKGFLTGAIKRYEDFGEHDLRRRFTRFQGDNFRINLEIVSELEGIAREYRITPAQVALAWVLRQGEDIVPIPGTSKEERLYENMQALRVSIKPEDMAKIDRIASLCAGDFEVTSDTLETL